MNSFAPPPALSIRFLSAHYSVIQTRHAVFA